MKAILKCKQQTQRDWNERRSLHQWLLVSQMHGWGAEILSHSDGLIAELINDNPPRGKLEMEANAKIMAASKELLDALKQMVKAAEATEGFPTRIIDIAVDAIIKAE